MNRAFVETFARSCQCVLSDNILCVKKHGPIESVNPFSQNDDLASYFCS
jgi:hypothetical protein